MPFLEVLNSCAMMRFDVHITGNVACVGQRYVSVGNTERITKSPSHVSIILVFVAVEAIIQHNGLFQSYHSGHPHSHIMPPFWSPLFLQIILRHQMHLFMREMFMCSSMYYVKAWEKPVITLFQADMLRHVCPTYNNFHHIRRWK